MSEIKRLHATVRGDEPTLRVIAALNKAAVDAYQRHPECLTMSSAIRIRMPITVNGEMNEWTVHIGAGAEDADTLKFIWTSVRHPGVYYYVTAELHTGWWMFKQELEVHSP